MLKILCTERTGLVGDIGTFLGGLDVSIKNIQFLNQDSDYGNIMIELLVKTPREVPLDKLIEGLLLIEGVKSINNSNKKAKQNCIEPKVGSNM